MKNIVHKVRFIGVDHADPASERSVLTIQVESLEALLNETRADERKNQAVLVSSQLEKVANQIGEMSAVEVADLLNQMAERMINQSREQH
ncbi:TPA: DUF2732 family protein [Yersinia enterocolitica]|uniref:DUF2732 family protein n=1 Tax=Yersinia TaxID=629 RepID=UPI0005E615CB|nr:MULTISPECIES: DUF2732 family protein [Yersinia]EKN3733665.1 DUF2732 family protein [Yersinia enterocolitica]EKN4035309.1 DUF2732 family protein [Yersinia enterocolitica]EKN4799650.1 DUF2732 family protein [Yersinia enterocolitica]EKN4845916.1 DUF2732 family protein [Yersinia enterocolitica]EKN5075360.1 DUF2732 family protein [Yersinia enterocolitica]